MVKNRWCYYTRQINFKTWLLSGPGFLCIIGWLFILISSCETKQARRENTGPMQPVTGINSSLEDEITNLPAAQIAWSTYWKVCWNDYPGAKFYEIQIITSEGLSPKLRKTIKSCYRIQMAAGKNAKSQGLLQREMLISLQSSQLGYKVRAVLNENTFSEWSRVIRAEAE